MKRLKPFIPLLVLVVLLVGHELLWRGLAASDAAASLFSSGPFSSPLMLIAVFVFMATRLVLYLLVPGWLVALVLRHLFARARPVDEVKSNEPDTSAV